jgi:PPM family protein phosphatase
MISPDAGVEATRKPESHPVGDIDLVLEIGQATDPGVGRRENEDALAFECPPDPVLRRERGALFVVCDGIGGLVAGDYASKRAVRVFIGQYYAAPKGTCDRMLRYAAEQTNRDLGGGQHNRSGVPPMGTTLVAALVIGRQFWVLNVGDSRAYIWRQAILRQISRDHTPDPHRQAGDRRINRALGTDPDVVADVFGPLPLAPGDRVLLCTDGLTTAVSEAQIARILGEFTSAEAARQLVEQAKTSGTRDNTTVITVGVKVENQPAFADAPVRRGQGWFALVQRWLAEITWQDVNPAALLLEGGWRTRRGAMILAGWLTGALLLGMLLEWFLFR